MDTEDNARGLCECSGFGNWCFPFFGGAWCRPLRGLGLRPQTGRLPRGSMNGPIPKPLTAICTGTLNRRKTGTSRTRAAAQGFAGSFRARRASAAVPTRARGFVEGNGSRICRAAAARRKKTSKKPPLTRSGKSSATMPGVAARHYMTIRVQNVQTPKYVLLMA